MDTVKAISEDKMAVHHRNPRLNFWVTPNGKRLYVPDGDQHKDVVESLGYTQAQALAQGFIRVSCFFAGLAIEAIEASRISDDAYSTLCLFASEFPQYAETVHKYLTGEN